MCIIAQDIKSPIKSPIRGCLSPFSIVNVAQAIADGTLSVPTIGDSNGDRWGFNGSVWTETDEGEPRFYNGALYMEGSHTELSGYSGDLTNWSTTTTASATQNSVGLRGNSNEAFTLTDSDNANFQRRAQNTTITSGTDKYYMMTRVAYLASPSTYPFIYLTLIGGTQLSQSLIFDQSDGSYTEISAQGSVDFVVRVGDWWFICQSLTDNASGNTVAQMNLDPARSDDGATLDNTVTGSCVFASCELYKDSPSYAPILTTGGSTKTVNADTEYTIPIGNWPDGDVSVEMEVTPFFDEANHSNQGIITPNSATETRIYFSTIAKRIVINDGSNALGLSNAWANIGQTFTLKAIASVASGKMNLSSDGVTATEGNYDGSFNPSGSIVLGKSLTRAMAIKNIKIYPVSLGDGWLGS